MRYGITTDICPAAVLIGKQMNMRHLCTCKSVCVEAQIPINCFRVILAKKVIFRSTQGHANTEFSTHRTWQKYLLQTQ